MTLAYLLRPAIAVCLSVDGREHCHRKLASSLHVRLSGVSDHCYHPHWSGEGWWGRKRRLGYASSYSALFFHPSGSGGGAVDRAALLCRGVDGRKPYLSG